MIVPYPYPCLRDVARDRTSVQIPRTLDNRPSSTMKSLTVLTIASLALAQSDSIVGTWSTKSNSTFTGPVRLSLRVPAQDHDSNTRQGFYDVAKDAMIEPAHPGISYSFTDDGFFEEAYFRAIANRMYTP